MEKPDIVDRDSVKRLVDEFYNRIRQDQELGPIFEGHIQGNWPSHLETMYDFWESVLFRAGKYHGNPPLRHRMVHEKTQLTPTHFSNWLTLFRATLDDLFQGPKATFARRAAEDIAQVLQRKIFNPPTINFQPLKK